MIYCRITNSILCHCNIHCSLMLNFLSFSLERCIRKHNIYYFFLSCLMTQIFSCGCCSLYSIPSWNGPVSSKGIAQEKDLRVKEHRAKSQTEPALPVSPSYLFLAKVNRRKAKVFHLRGGIEVVKGTYVN